MREVTRIISSFPASVSGVDVPVARAGPPFEDEMIRRAVLVEFDVDVALRICTAEDLVVLKAFADRLQDRADLLGIARRRGRQLDWDVIAERLAPFVEAKGEPAILANLETLRKEFS